MVYIYISVQYTQYIRKISVCNLTVALFIMYSLYGVLTDSINYSTVQVTKAIKATIAARMNEGIVTKGESHRTNETKPEAKTPQRNLSTYPSILPYHELIESSRLVIHFIAFHSRVQPDPSTMNASDS